MSSARIRRKTGRMKIRDLPPRDRAEVKRFQNFLRAVGPREAPEYPAKIRAWVADGDPVENLAWLGLSPAQGRKLGLIQ